MPAQKNKISAKLDFENREKRTPAIQRFITEPEKPEIHEIKEIVREQPAGERFLFKNTMEETVLTEVTMALKHKSDMCKCEKCRCDICAIVLNSLPQSYATTEQGTLMGKARVLLNYEARNKISSEIFKAIDIVKNNPMHN